jgi:hypothetical protein
VFPGGSAPDPHATPRDTSVVEPDEHRVAIVLDPFYGERAIQLARRRHVWLVRSDANEAVVARLRQDTHGYTLDGGVTIFDGEQSPEASFFEVLDAVDLHHGEHSHDPPLSVLEVIGLTLSGRVKDTLSDYGFRDTEPRAGGFVARRDSGARPCDFEVTR